MNCNTKKKKLSFNASNPVGSFLKVHSLFLNTTQSLRGLKRQKQVWDLETQRLA